MTLAPGTTVGRYQILEPLGQGGMATVYKAFQPSLEREVALKVLRPGFAQDDEFRERFEREAKAIARLRHPHVVQVFDFEITSSGEYALAMEFLEGGTLKERLTMLAANGRGLDPTEAVRILGEVAEALAYAHEKGIVHRDVKPSNVMLTRKDWAVVTDFGIARILGATSHTQTGVGIGTPEYMAPEQGQGGQIDHRADIYSLGAMAYEVLVGRVPYSADTPLAIVIAHIKDPLPLPSITNPTIGKGVERALLKALAKDPAQRYDTATAFTDALRTGLAEDSAGGTVPTIVVRGAAAATPTAVGVAPAAAPAARSASIPIPPVLARRPVVLGVVAALVVALVGGTVVSNALRAAPGASPTPPAGAAPSGTFASLVGEVIYQPKLDQAPQMGGEVNLNGEATATKVGGGQIEMIALAGQQQTEVVFNAGAFEREQYAMEMKLALEPGSTLRFAFCPRSGLASPTSPAQSYCFTLLIRDADPSYSAVLRYEGPGSVANPIGEAVVLPKATTLKLGAVIDRNVFRLWVDDREVLNRTDDRLTTSAVPPLVQVSRLGSDPGVGGTVRIREVRLYRLAGRSGTVPGPTQVATGGCQFPPCPSAPGVTTPGQGAARPPRSNPPRGALIYEARLDGATQVIQDPRIFTGAAGSATARYVPGAMELSVVSAPTLFGGQLRNAPRRTSFVLEFDVSATANADLMLSFDWGSGGATGQQRTYHFQIDVGSEIALLNYQDQTDASKSKTVIEPVPLAGLRSGQTLTVALVVDGARRALYVNESAVQPAEHDPQLAVANPLGVAIGTGDRGLGSGTVRVHSLRMYEVR